MQILQDGHETGQMLAWQMQAGDSSTLPMAASLRFVCMTLLF